MNPWKFIGFMLLASFGIYGVCVLFDSEFKMEYIFFHYIHYYDMKHKSEDYKISAVKVYF